MEVNARLREWKLKPEARWLVEDALAFYREAVQTLVEGNSRSVSFVQLRRGDASTKRSPTEAQAERNSRLKTHIAFIDQILAELEPLQQEIIRTQFLEPDTVLTNAQTFQLLCKRNPKLKRGTVDRHRDIALYHIWCRIRFLQKAG